MTTITIAYPTDPLGVVPGGTDTCIRDILRCAPDDITMQLVGVTTNPAEYKVGQWNKANIRGTNFNFFPLMAVKDLNTQMRIPLSVKFTLKLFNSDSLKNSDVIQFNRIEPALAALKNKQPKIVILHQNMNVLRNKNSDIRWKYLPGLYFWVESLILRKIREIFIVREDAVVEYKERFPEKKNEIHFLPTWMNPDLFYFQADKKTAQKLICNEFGLPVEGELMIFVGRFDHQKDPILLIESVAEAFKLRPDGKLILIGDGVLKQQVIEKIAEHKLTDRIKLIGAQSQESVAKYLRASDLLLLSSAYEGMPRCVVESLGSGVPVVTTNAGEVTLLVHNDSNGYIVEERDARIFGGFINKALDKVLELRGKPCVDAVDEYRDEVVLKKLYTTYRELAK